MNKKLIIGVVVAGLVIAGGVYLYNRNKKAKDTKNNLATESDAIAFLDGYKKRDDKNFSVDETKDFIQLYTANIDKDLHKRLIIILGKKESDFNTKDKLDLSIIKEKVTEPLKDKNKQERKDLGDREVPIAKKQKTI
jgi:hypothetical protein